MEDFWNIRVIVRPTVQETIIIEKIVVACSSQVEGTRHRTWGPGGGAGGAPESVGRWKEGGPGNKGRHCGFYRKDWAKQVNKAYDCSWNNFNRLWGHRGCL